MVRKSPFSKGNRSLEQMSARTRYLVRNGAPIPCTTPPSHRSRPRREVLYVFLQKYLYLHPASFGVNSQLTPPASFAAGAGFDTRAAARTTLSRPVGRVFVEERVHTRDLCVCAQFFDACYSERSVEAFV